MLKTYKTYNSTIGFSKYEFYYKLLDGVILLRVTPGVTWTQPIYIYIYIGQDLGTVLRYCSLGLSFKILSYEFFHMGLKCIF